MFALTSRFGTVSAHFGVSGAFFGVREDLPFLGRALWRAIGPICNESSELLMERPRVGPSL